MNKLFAHRGYNKGLTTENSIASLEEAVKNSFTAIEFDIWFFKNHLVIKHDKPKLQELSSLPKLREYLKYSNILDYWCDFKNINEKNARIVAKTTKELVSDCQILPAKIFFTPYLPCNNISRHQEYRKIFAEIRQEILLEPLSNTALENGNKGFNLVAVIDDMPNNSTEKGKIFDFINSENFDYFSINHRLINQELLKNIEAKKVLAWTVNSFNDLARIKALGVENFTSDTICPKELAQNN
jgi:glycerophosphoryl diester phosphodiesterase